MLVCIILFNNMYIWHIHLTLYISLYKFIKKGHLLWGTLINSRAATKWSFWATIINPQFHLLYYNIIIKVEIHSKLIIKKIILYYTEIIFNRLLYILLVLRFFYVRFDSCFSTPNTLKFWQFYKFTLIIIDVINTQRHGKKNIMNILLAENRILTNVK